jgi:putative ABC transport system ATP-binding protein
MSFIKIDNVLKIYSIGMEKVYALNDVSFEVEQGDFISVMGESGSGKSTLLSILGTMLIPDQGSYFVDDIDILKLSSEQQSDFRREYLGFVFQSFYLMPYLTVLENVMLPLVPKKLNNKKKREMAKNALDQVGLGNKYNRLINEISGGEKERVAIARAIVNEPPILLADEPTGNLDSKTSDNIMNLFTDLNKSGITIIMVTHSNDCASYADKKILLSDGKIIEWVNRERKRIAI